MELDKMSAGSRVGLSKINGTMPFAISKEDCKARMLAIVERVTDGENLIDIAAELGVSRHRIYQLMAEHAEDAWKSAQVARALMTLDDAEAALENCRDMVQVVAANARLKSAQWQLEKLHRRLFGADQPGQSQVVQINIAIERDQDKALDNAVTVTSE